MSIALQTLADKLANRLGLGNNQGLIETLKNTAFRSKANDDQLVALLIVSEQYGLNPWTKEIYAFPDANNGIVPVVGIDGWSRIINENKNFDGMAFKQDENSCTCIIYRKDRTHQISITEFADECRKNSTPWKTHPKRMLRHKAMIQCARIAFGFAGIYDPDEAERIIEGTATEVKTGKENNEKRPTLIAKCEEAALNGIETFGNLWQSLTTEERQIIGNDEKERIKNSIALDADYEEVP